LDAEGAGRYLKHMESPRFLTGQFLLAMPGIGDPRFERAVIAICAHDEKSRAARRA
jgi:putative transcriptional regulator